MTKTGLAERTSKPPRKDLSTVEGWLLLYVIVPGIVGGLVVLLNAFDFLDMYTRALNVVIGLFQLVGGIAVFISRSWVVARLHQWYWFGMTTVTGLGAFSIVQATGKLPPEAFGVAFGSLIWCLYWSFSKRVQVRFELDDPFFNLEAYK